MFGKRSGQTPQRPPSDPLSGAGTYMLILGGVMFILPTYFHRSWLLTSWLGSMEPPVGLSLMVVGGVLLVSALLRGRIRRAGLVPPVTEPSNVPPPPPGPVAAQTGSASAMAATSVAESGGAPAAPLGAGIDAPPPPLEPLYRPPTSLDDLGPSGPASPPGPG